MCGMNYERKGIVSIDEFLSTTINKKEATFLGETVKVSSHRMKVFKRSTVCSSCALKGSFFALERHTFEDAPASYHLNLYGVKDDGEEVIFTRDHTKPLARGGANTMLNSTTMCGPCNWGKADTYTKPTHAPTPKKPKKEKVKSPVQVQIKNVVPMLMVDMVIETTKAVDNVNNRINISPSEKKITIRYVNEEQLPLLIAAVENMQRTIRLNLAISFTGQITVFHDDSVRILVRSNKHTSKIVSWHNKPEETQRSWVSSIKNIFKKLFPFSKNRVESSVL
jgi:hypothetical protein